MQVWLQRTVGCIALSSLVFWCKSLGVVWDSWVCGFIGWVCKGLAGVCICYVQSWACSSPALLGSL